MNYVILDLEFNGSYSKKHKKYINEIIEFGAVKVNSKMQIIDSFSMLIKPQISKKINKHIVELTHLSNEEVFSSENSFSQVVKKFNKFMSGSILLTWGTTDILTLIDNFIYLLNKDKISFVKYYCNLQEYCEHILEYNIPNTQLSLNSCADMLALNANKDEAHRAYNDALISYNCFKLLYDKRKVKSHTVKTNNEFYKKITFKTKTITDLNNPLVDKKQFYFDCQKCNHRANQKTNFILRNRSFIAYFICPECGNEFKGKITLKLKYEGLIVKKKVVTSNKDANENIKAKE